MIEYFLRKIDFLTDVESTKKLDQWYIVLQCKLMYNLFYLTYISIKICFSFDRVFWFLSIFWNIFKNTLNRLNRIDTNKNLKHERIILKAKTGCYQSGLFAIFDCVRPAPWLTNEELTGIRLNRDVENAISNR